MTTYININVSSVQPITYNVFRFSNIDSLKDRETMQKSLKSSKTKEGRLDYTISTTGETVHLLFNEQSAYQQQVLSHIYREYSTSVTQHVSLVSKGLRVDTAIELKIYVPIYEFVEFWAKMTTQLK